MAQAASVGLGNVTVSGMAYTLYGGRAWWDRAGVSNNTKYYSFGGQRIALRKNGVLTYLHADHLGSTAMSTDAGGNVTVNQGYYAYGRYRGGGVLPTDRRFTGQQRDDTGLYYYNARYYAPLVALRDSFSPSTRLCCPGYSPLFCHLHLCYTVYRIGLTKP